VDLGSGSSVLDDHAAEATPAAWPEPTYGAVVDSVNVSVFEYVPVRSGSLAPIACLKPSATLPLDTGPFQLLGVVLAWSGWPSAKPPFVSRRGSEALGAASAPVEITFAVVCAVSSLATPGVNAPNDGGDPSVSASVAGTGPPASVAASAGGEAEPS